MTAPHIGNTGSTTRTTSRAGSGSPATWSATRPGGPRTGGPPAVARRRAAAPAGVVGIAAVDTRALTRHLRERGAMRAGIFSGDGADRAQRGRLVAGCAGAADGRRRPGRRGHHRRAVRRRGRRAEQRFTVAARRPRASRQRPRAGWPRAGSRCTSCPPTSTVEEMLAVQPRRGLLLATARATRPPPTTRSALARRARRGGCRCSASASATRCSAGRSASAPTSSATATAASTSRCRTGHRQGRDHRAQPRLRGRGAPLGARLRHRVRAGRGDATSASTTAWSRGCGCLDVPAFTVQYHPEAAAGPHDAAYLFDRFCELMERRGRPPRSDHDLAALASRLNAQAHRPKSQTSW